MQYLRVFIVLMTYPPFFTGFLFLLSWLIWVLLKLFHRRRPAFSTMFIYSISVAVAFIRYRLQVLACLRLENYCEVPFSIPLFILEVALWFLVLYILMRLVLRAMKSDRKG